MTEKPSGTWKWCLLIVCLAFVHIFVVTRVESYVINRMIQSDLRRAINQPLYQPGWLHDAFIYVFMFPASVIVRAFRPEPSKFFVLPVFIFTLLLWGCIWAEPFRRRYGWQPWRFTTRDLLIIITIVAALLGLFAWLH